MKEDEGQQDDKPQVLSFNLAQTKPVGQANKSIVLVSF